MKPVAIVRPQAESDLYKQRDYIAGDNPRAAQRFVKQARSALDLLSEMPTLGSECTFNSPRAAGLRMWPIRGFENYVIFYRQIDNGIEAYRVLHAARDLESFF